MPVTTPVPVRRPAAPKVQAPPPPPPPVSIDGPHTSWLVVPSVQLSDQLTDYRDCSGQTALPAAAPARDWCAVSQVVYLVGHNQGSFTPLLGAHVGDMVRYWDPSGAATTYRITSIKRMPSSAAPPYMTDRPHPHLV